MELPIFDQGREIGRLRLARDGLYTVFEARLPPREGLTRLYLRGGGETRLLGLMQPEGDRLTLRRRLSRASLPPSLDCAVLDPEEPKGAPIEARRASSDAAPRLPSKLLLLPCSPALAKDPRLRTAWIGGKCCLVFRR